MSRTTHSKSVKFFNLRIEKVNASPFFGKLNATGPTQGGVFTFSIDLRDKKIIFSLFPIAFLRRM